MHVPALFLIVLAAVIASATVSGGAALGSRLAQSDGPSRLVADPGAEPRSILVHFDDASGVARFVGPGDRIDIVLTRVRQGQMIRHVLLRDITVVSMNRLKSSAPGAPDFGATLAVAVDAAREQTLAIAQQIGVLSLTLRGVGASPPPDSAAPAE